MIQRVIGLYLLLASGVPLAAAVSERASALVALGGSGDAGSNRVQQIVEAGLAGSGTSSTGGRLFHGFAAVLINDPYLLGDDSFILDGAEAASLDVLSNDRDIDGGPLSLTSVSGAQHGLAVLSGGTISYQPQPGSAFSGSDSLTYTVTDAEGYSSQATVELTLERLAPN